jgi:hypothetical protein
MDMKRITGIGLIALGLFSVSCSSTKKAATPAGNGAVTNANIACSDLQKEAGEPRLDWIIEKNSVLDNLTTLAKPSSYKVYSLDTNQMRSFFKAYKDAADKQAVLKILLPLPEPVGCRTYTLAESGVMPAKLKEKYPDIVSLKSKDGTGVRLDYDGLKIRAQVTEGADVYVFTPVRNNGTTYYMVYKRSETGEKKEQFEQKLVPSTQEKFDR